MNAQPLDFWNHPSWLGDDRDNPRDPNHEPFWKRAAHVEYLAPPMVPSDIMRNLSEMERMALDLAGIQNTMDVKSPDGRLLGIINPVTGIVTMDDGKTMSLSEYRQHLALNAI